MPTSLEELEARVRSLETFRTTALGRVHAASALILERWIDLLTRGPDPVGNAKELRRRWLEAAPAPSGLNFDPARPDPVVQAYRAALDDLTGELLRRVEAETGQKQ